MSPEFVMLIGLPGSGKTAWAKEYAQLMNHVLFSVEDYTRRIQPSELNQELPNAVFTALYNDLLIELSKGNSVVMDSSNVTLKSRLQAFQRIGEIECTKVAIVFTTSYEDCVKRFEGKNQSEYKKLVFDKMSKFEIPTKGEGFDDIIFIPNESAQDNDVNEINALQERMELFNQNSPRHKFTLGAHSRYVANQFTPGSVEYYAGLYHDVGKLFTASKDERGHFKYFGHASVSAYYILSNFSDYFIKLLGNSEFYEMLHLINNHTKIKTISESAKSLNRHIKLWGQDTIEKLIVFSKADSAARKTKFEKTEEINNEKLY